MNTVWKKRLILFVGVLTLLVIALAAWLFTERTSKVSRPSTLDLRPDRYSALAGRESPQLLCLQDYFYRHYQGPEGQGRLVFENWPLTIWPDDEAEHKARQAPEMTDILWQVEAAGEVLTARAEDQLAYLEYLVARGQKRAFFRQFRDWQTFFLCPDGEGAGFYRLLTFHGGEQIEITREEELSWSRGLRYLRVLALAESQWPRARLRQAIQAQADHLKSALERVAPSVTIVAGEIVYPLVGATEKDLPAEPSEKKEAVLPIADLDLFALRALVELEIISEDLYLKYQKIVAGSARGAGFFAAYYVPKTESYVLGSRAFVLRSETSLAILSHLLEVGEGTHQDDVQQWFLRFYERGSLASSYHLVTGQAIGEPEPIALARLGRLAALREQTALHDDIARQLNALGFDPPGAAQATRVYRTADGRHLYAQPHLEMLLAGY